MDQRLDNGHSSQVGEAITLWIQKWQKDPKNWMETNTKKDQDNLATTNAHDGGTGHVLYKYRISWHGKF